MSAENFDYAGLLCTETCFTDNNGDIDNEYPLFNHQISNLSLVFDDDDDDDDQSVIKAMVERETHYLPKDDYLSRLRNGHLDFNVRREALDWIFKAYAHFGFGALCVCLAVNYLDRFLSVYEFPRGKNWTTQLLAVACLSLAAKMDEIRVPLSVDLQVGGPKFVFEAKTIQRMELLVLSTLNWRMQSVTPCSYIDYYLRRINEDDTQSSSLISRPIQLILSTIRGIDFLEFKPSEIGAAVAICVLNKREAVDVDKAMPCLHHVEQETVWKCVRLIKDLLSVSVSSNGTVVSAATSVPQSPSGVLVAACLSYKTGGTTAEACANSSNDNPDPKRRKYDIPPE